jgi:hypothetical protein
MHRDSRRSLTSRAATALGASRAHGTYAAHDKEKSRLKPNSAAIQWTRLRPIRTVAEIQLEFAVFTKEPFQFQRIVGEAQMMRRLGMSLRAVGAALGVDEKTVRNALQCPLQARPRRDN